MARVFQLLVELFQHLFLFLPVRVRRLFVSLLHKPCFFIENPIELFLHVAGVFKNPIFVPPLPLHKVIILLFLVFFLFITVIIEPKLVILILNNICFSSEFLRLLSLL